MNIFFFSGNKGEPHFKQVFSKGSKFFQLTTSLTENKDSFFSLTYLNLVNLGIAGLPAENVSLTAEIVALPATNLKKVEKLGLLAENVDLPAVKVGLLAENAGLIASQKFKDL